MSRVTKFIDTSKCTGCRGCQVACKNWNELPAEILPFKGSLQTHSDTSPSTFTYVKMIERNQNGKIDWLFQKQGCMHCKEAACVEVCPRDALTHTAEGAVVRDKDKCMGCDYCAQYCPFGIPKINEKEHLMYKCHLCSDRIANGLKPACASTCAPGAIQFGYREEMVQSAKARLEEVKKDYPNANLYGLDEQFLGGTGVVYLLLDKPEVYGLNPNPSVPAITGVWQNVIQPVGKVLPLAAAGAVLFSAFMNRVNQVKHAEEKGQDKGGSING